MKKSFKPIALVLVFSVFLTSIPIQSQAKWREMDSNLPGFAEGPSTALLIVSGVVLAGGIYAIIKISQHKKKINAINKAAQSYLLNPVGSSGYSFDQFNPSGNSLPENVNLSFCPETDLATEIQNTAQKLPVDVFVAPVSFSEKFDLTKTNGLQIGVTIKF